MKEYSADIYCHVPTIRVTAKNKRHAKKKIIAKLRRRKASSMVDWHNTDIDSP